MRIIDRTGKSKGPYFSIVDAIYVDDYRLLITFNDGISRIVDFGEFLRGSSHPDVKKYLDIRNFKAFHIEYGDLRWGDFDLIFPIIELHRGYIEIPSSKLKASHALPGRNKSIPSNGRRVSNTKARVHAG
jgi:hypothetical protein